MKVCHLAVHPSFFLRKSLTFAIKQLNHAKIRHHNGWGAAFWRREAT